MPNDVPTSVASAALIFRVGTHAGGLYRIVTISCSWKIDVMCANAPVYTTVVRFGI